MKKLFSLLIMFVGALVLSANTWAYPGSLKSDTGKNEAWHQVTDTSTYVNFRYQTKNSLKTETVKTDTDNFTIYNSIGELVSFKYSIMGLDSTTKYLKITERKGSIEREVFLGQVEELEIYTAGGWQDNLIRIRNKSNNQQLYELSRDRAVKIEWLKKVDFIETDIDGLPITTGNSKNTSGDIGTVSFQVDGNNVSLMIMYQSKSYLVKKVIENTAFLSNVTSGKYYSQGNEKFITADYATNENNSDVLFNGDIAQNWAGLVIWNLTTSDIQIINNARVFTYLDLQSGYKVYAYLYMPDIPVDKYLSISTSFKTQASYWVGTGDKITHSVILEADKTSTSIPGYVNDVISYSSAATIAGAGLAMLGATGVGMPLAVVGSIIWVGASQLKKTEWIQNDINQINNNYRPDTAFKTVLEKEYTKTAGYDVKIDTTNGSKVAELYLGQFSYPFQRDLDISSFGVSNISWITDGKVYYVTEDQITLFWSKSEKFKISDPIIKLPGGLDLKSIAIFAVAGLAIFISGFKLIPSLEKKKIIGFAIITLLIIVAAVLGVLLL